MKDGCKNY